MGWGRAAAAAKIRSCRSSSSSSAPGETIQIQPRDKIGFAPVDLLYSESLTKVTKVTKKKTERILISISVPQVRDFIQPKYTVRLLTGLIGVWCCACRDWPFSSASKPIDLGLGFQVHWVHIKLGFPASSLVGTLNG